MTVWTKVKLVALVLLAFTVALSWLGLGFLVDSDPSGFAISSSDDGEQSTGAGGADQSASGTATPLAENVSVDDLRESLSRTSRGVSPKEVTAIWATETYWGASDVSTDSFRVSPADNHVFIVFLNTHTGALPQMNWTQDTRLVVDGTAYEPVDGYTRAGGYHHMVAVVQFPKTVDGQPITTEDTDEVTLRVVGVDRTTRDVPADRPRNLTWAYPPPYYDVPPEQIGDGDCDCTVEPTATQRLTSPAGGR